MTIEPTHFNHFRLQLTPLAHPIRFLNNDETVCTFRNQNIYMSYARWNDDTATSVTAFIRSRKHTNCIYNTIYKITWHRCQLK